ncbi:MAG: 4-alpha-glucanotransferase [Acidobacteria bacterium]|nr:4-alpha-glucanotransferase [Acidobacteriota bacterium]
MQLLAQAATLWGIEPEYWDIWGQRHVPSEPAQRAILSSLGVNCQTEDELSDSIRARELGEWTRPLPPVVVTTASEVLRFPIRVRLDQADQAVEAEIEFEDGSRASGRIELAACAESARQQAAQQTYVEKTAEWPLSSPPGYHRLRARLAGLADAECRLIVTPEQAWLPECLGTGGKMAGLAVSLFGVRSARNWGCGDFTDLEHLLEWLKEDLGASFLALNPLHAIDNRQPYNISPYLPSSAFFRNPLYLDIERVPEFQRSTAAQRLLARAWVQNELAKLRESEFVEYERIWRLKQLFLILSFRQLLRNPASRRWRELQRFAGQGGERLHRFAVYCALWRHLHKSDRNLWIWQDWPPQYQHPDTLAVQEFARSHGRQVLFHKYLQWLVDEQLANVQDKAKQLGLPIGLYHDLALTTDKCGADLWAYRPFYVSGCRVGSPPDSFAPNGQDWAFPPPNAEKHREDGYRFFIDSIRANSRHGSALRIDHVMRLFRLYWIPDGMEAKDGAYVRDFHADLLGILALESVRGRFLIVGEDLGTVADNVRRELDRFGVLGYKVFYFEKNRGSYRKPEDFPRQALVSSTTHDLPTLAGFWLGRDIEARKAAGLLPDQASYQRQLSDRARDKQLMLDLLHELELVPGWFPHDASRVSELAGELHNAIIGLLMETPSMLMVLNQEDLTKETEQQNLPASTWQYPNWRRKMKYSVEELRTLPAARDFAAMFHNWLVKSGRTRGK